VGTGRSTYAQISMGRKTPKLEAKYYDPYLRQKQKVNRRKEVVFNDEARKEFVLGFKTRKDARRKTAMKQIEKKERNEKSKARKLRTEHMKLALEAMKGKSNEVIDPDLMMPEDRNKNSEESESEDQEQDNKNQDQTKNTMETSVDQVGGGAADSAPSPRDDNGISNITGPSPGQTPDPNKKNEDEKVKVYENEIQKVTTTVTSFLPSQNDLKFPKEKEKQEKREELDETSANILAQNFDPKKKLHQIVK